jgi:hypothetical protein
MLTKEKHRELMYGLCIAAPTDSAENRMRTRTAKEQHRLAMEELNRGQDEVIPDADDAAMQGYWPNIMR